MEFKGPLLQALREQDPKLFKELCRTNKLDQFCLDRWNQAKEVLDQLLAGAERDKYGNVRDPNLQNRAEEVVRDMYLDFRDPNKDLPEPPDDLPKRASQIVS